MLIKGKPPPQLLKMIPGEEGVGKSKVVRLSQKIFNIEMWDIGG